MRPAESNVDITAADTARAEAARAFVGVKEQAECEGRLRLARELSYLAAIHANVHMDLGLAVPYLAADVPSLFRQALSLAPTSKLLFSTDAYSIPEIFWLAARWGRWGLTVALDALVAVGALGHEEALTIARDVLGGNAARLYGLPRPQTTA